MTVPLNDETVIVPGVGTREFSPARRTRLSTVTRAATLQERVQALEEEAGKLALMLEMCSALSSEKELDAVMQLIVDHTTRIIGCERSSVFLLDKAKDELFSLVAQGLDVKELRFGASAGIAGFVARHAVGLNVPDAYLDPRFNPAVDKATGYRTVSILCLPLPDRKGEVLGVIQCLNKKSAHGRPATFTTADEVVLSAVASQAAVFLDNTALRHQMDHLFESFVECISQAIEDRDPCTSGHTRRVMRYSMNLARAVHDSQEAPFDKVSYTRQRLRQLRYACLLHDVGKIGVREPILSKATRISAHNLEAVRARLSALGDRCRADMLLRACEQGLKPQDVMAREFAPLSAELAQAFALVEKVTGSGFLPDAELAALTALKERNWITAEEFHNLSMRRGNLTPEEMKDMRSHVDKSWRMLSQIPWPAELKDVSEVAYLHHERNDGSGYPRKLTENQIHLDGQIMCIADIYDALTAADRPYKKAIPHEKAREILEEDMRQGRIMPELLRLFFGAQCFVLTSDVS
jgi:HD-GYP domain-containing protein (c-di-GMP phosphodiesterase class II)